MDVETAETLEFKSIRMKGDLFQLLETGIPKLVSGFTENGSQGTPESRTSGQEAKENEPSEDSERWAIFPGKFDGRGNRRLIEATPKILSRLNRAAREDSSNLHLAYSYYKGETGQPNRAYERLKSHQMFREIEENSWSGFIINKPDTDFFQRAGKALGIKVIFKYRLTWRKPFKRSYEISLYNVGTNRMYEASGRYQNQKHLLDTLSINFRKMLFQSEVDSLKAGNAR